MPERGGKTERSHQPETPQDRNRSHTELPSRVQTLCDPYRRHASLLSQHKHFLFCTLNLLVAVLLHFVAHLNVRSINC